MSIEAMKLALEAFETGTNHGVAVDKLRQALEQAEQAQPVAWIDEFGNVFPLGAQRGPKYLNEPMKPLYTAPPPRQPWVGLTDEEKQHCVYDEQGFVLDYEDCVNKTEAKLKEKNT